MRRELDDIEADWQRFERLTDQHRAHSADTDSKVAQCACERNAIFLQTHRATYRRSIRALQPPLFNQEIVMPIVRVTMTKGKSQEYIDKMSVSIDRALVEAYVMPDGDLFQMFDQLEPGAFKFDRYFGGGPRSDDFMIIVIRSDSRRKVEKKVFAKLLVEKLQSSPGIRPEDVFLILDTNSTLEDYSFGRGALVGEDLQE